MFLRSHAERGNEVTGGRARLFLLARRVAGVRLLWDLCELCGLVVLRSHAEHGNEVFLVVRTLPSIRSHAEHGNEVVVSGTTHPVDPVHPVQQPLRVFESAWF